MPAWTRSNSGGYGYNQNNYNTGYGRQNTASDNQSGFGFGNRQRSQRNTSQNDQFAAGNRQQGMNQRGANQNPQGMYGNNRQQAQNTSRPGNFGNGQQYQQQFQQPTQGMPQNMPAGFGNGQQFQQQFQQPAQGMPQNMPAGFGNGQQFQQPAQGTPQNMPVGFGNGQQFQQPTQGMPQNIPTGSGNGQQFYQASQGMSAPPNMPINYNNPQPFQQQQPSQSTGIPHLPGMVSGFGDMQQFPSGSATTDQLEAINRDLPDGVKYHPLDMKNLSMPGFDAVLPSGGTPQTSVPPYLPPNAPIFPPTNKEPNLGSNPYIFMEKFIQNEQNGAMYYKHLATLSPTSEIRSIISDIGNDCTKRKDTFSALYASKTSNSFSPANVEINNQTTFRDGISFAIKEESKTLRELSEIYENAWDEKIQVILNSRMYRKVSDISYLHFINSKI